MKNYEKPSVSIEALIAESALASDKGISLLGNDDNITLGGEVSIAVPDNEYWQP